ncbi:ATPase/histidine kinase/DNA gyrase B/HSP90 domain protein [Clostridium botulinum B str. Osaka05]|uniref:ATPase/histidine kinase/DNA gyrase B/HSP90 domain protein n=1 Tax=Clostridium botulinum B str. Osaka05 TaxID=1407017 RepID=A0A060N9F0_CLOBO|nr:hypothetical protein [Clostridium botulinum]BAO04794.1 ATPase/histidine kinase/DNA gyrase B/HSP90 domain protein [Clostridium botulinum B str. Osaka05]
MIEIKRVKAIKTNNALKYTRDKEYEARISQQCKSILFIINDNGDNVIVNKYDFI